MNIKSLLIEKYGLSYQDDDPQSQYILGCAMDIFASRTTNSHFDLAKAVSRLKAHGYSDSNIIDACEALMDHQFLVPDNYGRYNGFYKFDETEKQEDGSCKVGTHFPVMCLIKSELGRGEALGELTGVSDEYVTFKKMKNTESIEITDKAALW